MPPASSNKKKASASSSSRSGKTARGGKNTRKEHAPKHEKRLAPQRERQDIQVLASPQLVPSPELVTGPALAADPLITPPSTPPEILAPAGDMPSALAAFAAGADAVFLGLKLFSARMLAENFSSADVSRLVHLAQKEDRKVYVAMNTFMKPGELAKALRLIRRLVLEIQPHALIVQDPGFFPLAREAGFTGELHLSTLANVTHQKGLLAAQAAGAARVILPRELSLAEVAQMHEACPPGLSLELFVHGALCYCVSGRCWWSSYMGGKSGLRGRCVQPCRRVYTQKGKEGRFFSCLDLSLDSMVRGLLPLTNVRSWKIEGRRKGPHYVYHVVKAYQLLRDAGGETEARKEAEDLLRFALGRPGTRAMFSIPAEGAGKGALREASPLALLQGKRVQTSSGLLCGQMDQNAENQWAFKPKFALHVGDYLRVGYEDEPWHTMVSMKKAAPGGVPHVVRFERGRYPKPGTPVFLLDRKAPTLTTALKTWQTKLEACKVTPPAGDEINTLYPPVFAHKSKPAGGKTHIMLRSSLPQGKEGKAFLRPGAMQGLWITHRAVEQVSRTLFDRISWWLPPVIWPDEEAGLARLLHEAQRKGARAFVCNAPWQAGFFGAPGPRFPRLTAGPFCNITNAAAVHTLAGMGFADAIISPELGREDALSLPGQSPLPLGIVLDGFWPMGISRHAPMILDEREGFQSPKRESFWMRKYGQNTWIYPAWPLDLTPHAAALSKAGYSTFVSMQEHPPKAIGEVERTSPFNWDLDVL